MPLSRKIRAMTPDRENMTQALSNPVDGVAVDLAFVALSAGSAGSRERKIGRCSSAEAGGLVWANVGEKPNRTTMATSQSLVRAGREEIGACDITSPLL